MNDKDNRELTSSLGYTVHVKDNVFTRYELDMIFDACDGKTLGFLDRMLVFEKNINHPKVTGIAGTVIEQSVLGMKANTRQAPDLEVDGEEIELKTTGLKVDKDNSSEYVAKEPVTITAVSIETIVKEDNFKESTLWHKLRHLLFVYYHYDSITTVIASAYSKFKVLSHQFYEPSPIDRARYESDWIIVRDFLRMVRDTYENPEEGYPLLSTEINPKLVVLDTAPKYPNPPRFRIRRVYFTIIVKRHFANELEILPDEYVSYRELDDKLHEITSNYQGKLVEELISILDINAKKISKSISEQIIVRMFGGQSKSLSKVELFEAFGIKGKSFAYTIDNKPSEDMKMCPIDFDEVMEDKSFEESEFYHYFHDNTFLFFILRETQKESHAKGKEVKVEFKKNQFLGFKRLKFDDEYINTNVKPVWEKIRTLISTHTLRFVPEFNRNGVLIKNKTGIIKGAPNFPKKDDGIVFVRGTSSDSTDKPLVINGIEMYRQNLWISGKEIVERLSSVEYI